MSKKQYKRGKQICTISDFDESPSRYYIVYFGSTNPQTKHRSFLMSWQYRTLLNFIIKGYVFEANRIIEAKMDESTMGQVKPQGTINNEVQP